MMILAGLRQAAFERLRILYWIHHTEEIVRIYRIYTFSSKRSTFNICRLCLNSSAPTVVPQINFARCVFKITSRHTPPAPRSSNGATRASSAA